MATTVTYDAPHSPRVTLTKDGSVYSAVIEVEGLRRARMEMSRADLVLYVVDAARGFAEGELADLPAGTATLVVWNKCDLPEARPPPSPCTRTAP